MVDELQVPPFLEWLFGGQPWYNGSLFHWLLVTGTLVVAALAVGWLVAALRKGPGVGFQQVRRTLAAVSVDLLRISPRRVRALAWLAVKESIRRRVVVGFVVFVVVFLFGAWFLDPGSTNPGRLYLSFVLTATSYLVLVLVLFLSAFSLPTDLRNQTLHTVVTKPVRPSEIVLGRILGFTIIGTGLLVVMCAVSYVFVVRGLDHQHTLTRDDLSPIRTAAGDQPMALVGKTSWTTKEEAQRHRHWHTVSISASGVGRVKAERGHWHTLRIHGSGDQATYEIGPPEGILLARVPVYGKLQFRDREGVDTAKGTNIGDEWTYRSHVQGGSQAAAIWTFRNIHERMFPEGLPVEMTLGVYRTYKGNIERGILGSLSVRNPKTGLTVEVEIFESKEFATNQLTIPRKIVKFSSAQVISRKTAAKEGARVSPPPDAIDPRLAEKEQFDLFEDLVADGQVEIWLRCLEPKQYFGVAQPDLYLRASDAPFWLNFVKGYFGIWLQMLLVIGFGVMFSTFLSGPVAMLATLGVLVGGFFNGFMRRLATGETYGGGPLESLIRLVKQQSMLVELDPGLGGQLAKIVDFVLRHGLLRVMSAIFPPFGEFSYASHVAYGFDVSANLILVCTVGALGFLLPVFVVGCFFLKTREVAR